LLKGKKKLHRLRKRGTIEKQDRFRGDLENGSMKRRRAREIYELQADCEEQTDEFKIKLRIGKNGQVNGRIIGMQYGSPLSRTEWIGISS
jgi:hypothetical protein